MIVPHDFTISEDIEPIYGIPYRTMDALLHRISEEKGDNITVILDCCHSGGGFHATKDERTSVGRPADETVDIEFTVPSDLDESIWSDVNTHHSISSSEGVLQRDFKSHVLLAACGAKEFAHERRGRGYFTEHLLDLFRTVGVENLTYVSVPQKLKLKRSRQHPQCEGINQNRILFNLHSPNATLPSN
ncbi:hypothetical protein M422DRAFT_244344 [Sphaerobolus stellatus SS14]|nr:hypothetical protein M422DRAFT_244344 [Sphaerobolus stellatus SS14]